MEEKNTQKDQNDQKEIKELHEKVYNFPYSQNSPLHGTKDLEEEFLKNQKIILKKENKLKKLLYSFTFSLFLLIIIAIISFIKGDIYWIRDFFGFGLPKDPQKAVEKTIQKISKIKSYSSEIEANLDLEIENKKINGEIIAFNNFNNEKEEIKSSVKVKNFNFPGGKSLNDLGISNIEGDFIVTKKEIFFKLPLLENKWYKTDFNKLLQIEKFSKDIKNQDFVKLSGVVFYSSNYWEVETTELGKYLKSAKKLKDEKIENKKAYHYLAEIDLIKILENNEEFKKITDSQKELIKKILSKYANFKIDYWISRKNLMLIKQRVEFDFKINMEEFGKKGVLNLNFDFTEKFKDFNKPIDIEIPKDVKDFDESILSKIISGQEITSICGNNLEKCREEELPSDIQIQSRNEKRKSDLKQIKTALELYYDSEGKYPILKDDSRDGVFLKILEEKNYLKKVPIDPLHPKYYYFYESQDGKTYKLTSIEETSKGIKIIDMSQK